MHNNVITRLLWLRGRFDIVVTMHDKRRLLIILTISCMDERTQGGSSENEVSCVGRDASGGRFDERTPNEEQEETLRWSVKLRCIWWSQNYVHTNTVDRIVDRSSHTDTLGWWLKEWDSLSYNKHLNEWLCTRNCIIVKPDWTQTGRPRHQEKSETFAQIKIVTREGSQHRKRFPNQQLEPVKRTNRCKHEDAAGPPSLGNKLVGEHSL